MARNKKSDIYRAKTSFSFDDPDTGAPVSIKAGELVRSGHPMLDGREELFEPADNKVRYDVEEATAEPGKQRGEQPGEQPAPDQPEAASDQPEAKSKDEPSGLTTSKAGRRR